VLVFACYVGSPGLLLDFYVVDDKRLFPFEEFDESVILAILHKYLGSQYGFLRGLYGVSTLPPFHVPQFPSGSLSVFTSTESMSFLSGVSNVSRYRSACNFHVYTQVHLVV
jgi:hypothetical protein